jgi:hypothetical protein
MVLVLLTEPDKTDWKSLKIPTAKGGQEVGPALLVQEASDAIVISPTDSLLSDRYYYSTAVYISKKNISEIVYLIGGR